MPTTRAIEHIMIIKLTGALGTRGINTKIVRIEANATVHIVK
jgi:hypothetical protein